MHSTRIESLALSSKPTRWYEPAAKVVDHQRAVTSSAETEPTIHLKTVDEISMMTQRPQTLETTWVDDAEGLVRPRRHNVVATISAATPTGAGAGASPAAALDVANSSSTLDKHQKRVCN